MKFGMLSSWVWCSPCREVPNGKQAGILRRHSGGEVRGLSSLWDSFSRWRTGMGCYASLTETGLVGNKGLHCFLLEKDIESDKWMIRKWTKRWRERGIHSVPSCFRLHFSHIDSALISTGDWLSFIFLMKQYRLWTCLLYVIFVWECAVVL